MRRLLLILSLLLISYSAVAQEPETDFDSALSPPTLFSIPNPNNPNIEFKANNPFLMRSFYPLYYKSERKIRRDVRFVGRNDSVLVRRWNYLGDSVLTTISTLSGIDWVEKNLNIHLLKYLPVIGMYDILAMPLEGIKTRDYIEAAPTGYFQFFNLIRLLAGRNLYQLSQPESGWQYLSNNPLLDHSAYRFDIISMTLALSVAEYFIPPDSLKEIINSDSWLIHNPGWQVYDNHFRYSWVLSPDTPLVMYLSEVTNNSPLIEITIPPRIAKPKSDKQTPGENIRLGAGGGRLGFSVTKTALGLLEVVDIDTTKLAYACGLQTEDRIKRVNGKIVRNARELMEKILNKIDTEGVYMVILRENQEIGLLLLPASDY